MGSKPKRTAPAAFVESGKKHRWKKGQSGNSWRLPAELEEVFKAVKVDLKGMSDKKYLTGLLRGYLQAPCPGDPLNRTIGEIGMMHLALNVARGEPKSVEMAFNRVEGLLQSHVALSGSVELPVGERLTELAGRLKSLADENKVQ